MSRAPRRPRRRSAAQIAASPPGPQQLPKLGPPDPIRPPRVHEMVLENGLRALALRQPSAPLVELRLYIPFGRPARARASVHAARVELLAATLLLGNHHRDRDDIDGALADIGGRLDSSVDPQRLLIYGSCLAQHLPELLAILAESLCGATYLPETVVPERIRLIEQLSVAVQQPSVIARQALQRHRFGDHRVSYEMPSGSDVARVSPAALRDLHIDAVVPGGALLMLTGDIRPLLALRDVGNILSPWASGAARLLDSPVPAGPGPLELVSRPGAVQSQVRLSLPGVLRHHPDYPALQIANMVFGGYFSSRLMANLREDKGFTYHATSGLEFWRELALLGISFDTATDVTAAAINETCYELAKFALAGPDDTEVDAARNYLLGALAISQATQAGRASLLTTLYANGLDAGWIARYARALTNTTTGQVAAAAARYLAPAQLSGIVAGDLAVMGDQLGRLGIG